MMKYTRKISLYFVFLVFISLFQCTTTENLKDNIESTGNKKAVQSEIADLIINIIKCSPYRGNNYAKMIPNLEINLLIEMGIPAANELADYLTISEDNFVNLLHNADILENDEIYNLMYRHMIMYILETLGRIAAPDNSKYIIPMLDKIDTKIGQSIISDYKISMFAAMALGMMKASESIPKLQETYFSSKGIPERSWIIWALGEMDNAVSYKDFFIELLNTLYKEYSSYEMPAPEDKNLSDELNDFLTESNIINNIYDKTKYDRRSLSCVFNKIPSIQESALPIIKKYLQTGDVFIISPWILHNEDCCSLIAGILIDNPCMWQLLKEIVLSDISDSDFINLIKYLDKSNQDIFNLMYKTKRSIPCYIENTQVEDIIKNNLISIEETQVWNNTDIYAYLQSIENYEPDIAVKIIHSLAYVSNDSYNPLPEWYHTYASYSLVAGYENIRLLEILKKSTIAKLLLQEGLLINKDRTNFAVSYKFVFRYIDFTDKTLFGEIKWTENDIVILQRLKSMNKIYKDAAIRALKTIEQNNDYTIHIPNAI